uniref:antimicrobial peptide NK-lysin-like n=1 Tax=Semicossyphus pulcher TaxID=241346 RepID=UPI0037E89F1D
MMSPAFNIALLLLSAAVVKSLEYEEDLELKQEAEDRHAEKMLQDEGLQDLCGGCKSLVTKLKKKMGDKASKAKVAKLLDKVCSKQKDELLEAACKKITGEVKDKLCEAVANGDDPKAVCKQVKLCKKKKPPPRL